jgi:hypothetical protein
MVIYRVTQKRRLGFYSINSCPYLNFEYKNFSERSKKAEISNPHFIIPKFKKNVDEI